MTFLLIFLRDFIVYVFTGASFQAKGRKASANYKIQNEARSSLTANGGATLQE